MTNSSLLVYDPVINSSYASTLGTAYGMLVKKRYRLDEQSSYASAIRGGANELN